MKVYTFKLFIVKSVIQRMYTFLHEHQIEANKYDCSVLETL